MLCKLVTLCGVCEGAFYTQVTNITQQMPIPAGQMDIKRQRDSMCGVQVVAE
jgi:hypothetical protein